MIQEAQIFLFTDGSYSECPEEENGVKEKAASGVYFAPNSEANRASHCWGNLGSDGGEVSGVHDCLLHIPERIKHLNDKTKDTSNYKITDAHIYIDNETVYKQLMKIVTSQDVTHNTEFRFHHTTLHRAEWRRIAAMINLFKDRKVFIKPHRIESHIEEKEKNPNKKKKIEEWLKMNLPIFEEDVKPFLIGDSEQIITSRKFSSIREFIIQGNEGADKLAKKRTNEIMVNEGKSFAFVFNG